MTTFVVLLKDTIAKKIFSSGSKASKEYLLRIISAVINIKMEDLENDFELIHPKVSVNNKIINSEVDLIGETSDLFINLEFNYQSKGDKGNIIRDKENFSYLCQLYLRNIKHKEDYENIKKIWQIQIDDFDYYNKGDFIYFSEMQDKKYHLTRNFGINIVDINLQYLDSLGYNNIKKADILAKSLYIFVCNDDKVLDELYKGDEVMEEIKKEVKSFDEAFDELLYYDPDKLFRQGIAYNVKKETVIELIKQNVSIATISKALKFKPKQIEEIWEAYLMEDASKKNDDSLKKLLQELLSKHQELDYKSFISTVLHLSWEEIDELVKE